MKTILSSIFLIIVLLLSSWVNIALNNQPIEGSSVSTVSFCGAYSDYAPDPVDTSQTVAPYLEGLGTLHHEISTKSKRAQDFFDQGLKLCYAFNHKESHSSFMQVTRLNPNYPMSYLGKAFALVSNLNDLLT